MPGQVLLSLSRAYLPLIVRTSEATRGWRLIVNGEFLKVSPVTLSLFFFLIPQHQHQQQEEKTMFSMTSRFLARFYISISTKVKGAEQRFHLPWVMNANRLSIGNDG